MVALAEERRQAASVDGGFHQAGLDAAAGRIEEPGVAVAGRIAVDAEGAFAQREGGVNEAAGVLGDRKSTRLNSSTNAHLVCRLLLEKKKHITSTRARMQPKTNETIDTHG